VTPSASSVAHVVATHTVTPRLAADHSTSSARVASGLRRHMRGLLRRGHDRVISRWSRHHIGERKSELTVTPDRKAFEPNAGRIQTRTDERDEHLLQDGGRHRLHSNLPAGDFCR
jgi:hypothetical protein